MSGGLAWARVDPSTNSTIEWTTDCGCTITVIRSIGMSKSRCASITSSPLLTSVAELMVMTGPIAQVGCAMRLFGGHVSQLGSGAAAERSPAGREHEPADLVGTPAHEALGQGGVLGVDGDDLTRARQRR